MRFLKKFVSFFRRFFIQPLGRPGIVFFGDGENLSMNTDPLAGSFTDSLDRNMHIIGKIGPIVKKYFFAPDDVLSSFGDSLRERGYTTVQCSKVIIDKTGPKTEKKDTVDPELIRNIMVDVKEMTHLRAIVIGSGDKDFAGVARWVLEQGVDVIILAGNRLSLSSDLISYASVDTNGRKMVYFLS